MPRDAYMPWLCSETLRYIYIIIHGSKPAATSAYTPSRDYYCAMYYADHLRCAAGLLIRLHKCRSDQRSVSHLLCLIQYVPLVNSGGGESKISDPENQRYKFLEEKDLHVKTEVTWYHVASDLGLMLTQPFFFSVCICMLAKAAGQRNGVQHWHNALGSWQCFPLNFFACCSIVVLEIP